MNFYKDKNDENKTTLIKKIEGDFFLFFLTSLAHLITCKERAGKRPLW